MRKREESLKKIFSKRLEQLQKLPKIDDSKSIEDVLSEEGISRRDFMKWAGAMTAFLGLSSTFTPTVAKAAKLSDRLPVIWLHMVECTGCSESLIRTATPTIDSLIFDYISLDYHETLMAAAGWQAEENLENAIKKYKGRYIMMVEGGIPTGDGGHFLTIGGEGKTGKDIAKETADGAAAIFAIGTCSSFGGVQAANPNPTSAVPLSKVTSKPVINVPGCPPSAKNIVGTLLHFILFGTLPALDAFNRPKWAYGHRIHDLCERRGHFDAGEFVEEFGDVVDFVLDFDREIVNACDDSVVQSIGDKRQTLRLARGYVPRYQKLPFKLDKKILCVGANQKNSITLAYEDIVVTSPHIGDLGSIESMEYFERSVESFKRFYDFTPDVIVFDKHPNYETTKWAKEQKNSNPSLEIYQIQHHYAHILSALAEFELKEKVLGFAWDGTGYGDDGSIWGGEAFVCDAFGYKRVGSFKPFKLIGGDKAIKEPRRVALSFIFELFSLEEILALRMPFLNEFSDKEIKNLYKIWKNTTLYTSSVGRIFDMFASFSSLLQVSNYEGESGLMLEACYNENIHDTFSYDIKDGIIDISPSFKEIYSILRQNQNIAIKREKIASMLINTLAKIVVDISTKYDMSAVLSGGVFQNKTLLQKVTKELEKEGKRVFSQQNTPINDGGISLGQAWWAINNLNKSLK